MFLGLQFFYSLLVYLVGACIFGGHYITASILTIFSGKNKEKHFYNLAIPFIKVGFFILGIRVKTHGLDNIPKESNVIFIVNHQSVLDIVVMMLISPKKLTFFAKKELSKLPIVNGDIRNMGHLFVDRENPRRSSEQIAVMQKVMEQGKNIIVFPEGTRAIDDKLLEFKRGVFVLAARCKKPLIPTYIQGSNKLITKTSFLCKPGVVNIYFGDAVTDFSDAHEKEESNRLKDVLYEKISEIKEKVDKKA